MDHYKSEIQAFDAKEKESKASVNADAIAKKGIAKTEEEWFKAEFERLRDATTNDYEEYIKRLDEHWGNETSIQAHIELVPYFSAELGAIIIQILIAPN